MLASAIYLSCPSESDSLVTQRTRSFIFGTCIKKCRTQGSVGKSYEGKTYTCMPHKNFTPRDESVKRGGGSVTNLEPIAHNSQSPRSSVISLSICV